MSIEVRGDDKAILAVEALAKDDWKDDSFGRFMDGRRDALEKEPEPPTRPGQRYLRTHQLKHGYVIQKQRKLVRVITNTAARRGREYGGYVVGDEQAWMHRGRWTKASDIIERGYAELDETIGAAGVAEFEAA